MSHLSTFWFGTALCRDISHSISSNRQTQLYTSCNDVCRNRVTKCMPFYQHHSGGTELRCRHCSERTVVWGFTVGGGDQYVLQAFVQSQIRRSGYCLNLKCSSSFLASPCFCLFSFWQSPSLFCYFSTVIFHICICFPMEMVLGLQRLFAGCYSASPSLSHSPFPAPRSSTHLPCRFIPSPHTAEHRLSFLNKG